MGIPTTPSGNVVNSSPRSSPRTQKTKQSSTNKSNNELLRTQISQALFLGDNQLAQFLYYDLLHPSRAPFDWKDVHEYALFLINHQHIPMRAFRVLRKCDLLEHPIAGLLAVEALIRMSRSEEAEEEQRNKLNEALELLGKLHFQPSLLPNFKKEEWEFQKNRLEESIKQKLKLAHQSTSLRLQFTKDWNELRLKFYQKDYEDVLELGNIYGGSPVAIPNEFLPSYLYALQLLNRKDELFSLAQWLVDEQGHLPYAWYAVALYYQLLPLGGGNERVKRFLLKAVSKDPTFIEAWLGLGELYSGRTGDHDLAVKALKQAMLNAQVQHRPDALEWSTMMLVGEYLRVKKPEEAQAILAKAPFDSMLAQNERAVALYQGGKVTEAFEILERLAKKCANDSVLLNYATLGVKLGKFSHARTALSLVKNRRQPGFLRLHAFVHEMLGLSGLDSEMLAIALDSYSLLLQVDPQDVFSQDASAKTLFLYKYLSSCPNNNAAEDGEEEDEMEMETD